MIEVMQSWAQVQAWAQGLSLLEASSIAVVWQFAAVLITYVTLTATEKSWWAVLNGILFAVMGGIIGILEWWMLFFDVIAVLYCVYGVIINLKTR